MKQEARIAHFITTEASSGICAHVGLPKTGSSYLQKNFFPQLGRAVYSTYPPFEWPAELDWIYKINKAWLSDLSSQRLCMPREKRERCFYKNTARQLISWEHKSKHWAEAREAHTLLSAEGLSGFSLPAAEMMANILRGMGVDRIVFVCRNQADWSLSLWRQLILREDRFARFVSYDQLFGNPPRPGQLGAIDMDWAEYLALYQEVFGEKQVLAIPYELLCVDPESFFVHIQKFLGVAEVKLNVPTTIENPSVSSDIYTGWKLDEYPLFIKMARLRKGIHKFLTPVVKLAPMLAKQVLVERQFQVMSRQSQVEMMRGFESSNRKLAELSGFDLGTYGYY